MVGLCQCVCACVCVVCGVREVWIIWCGASRYACLVATFLPPPTANPVRVLATLALNSFYNHINLLVL